MAKATSKKGSLFIQPDGPNTEMYYLGCHTMGDLTDSAGGAVTPFYCWDPSGNGWIEQGELTSPPDKISFTIDTRVDAGGSLDWTEIVSCPFSVYVLLRDCGRRDHFANNVRAWIMPEVRKLTTTYSGLVTMEEDVEATMSTTFEAAPQLIKPVEVAVVQQLPDATGAAAQAGGVRDLYDVCFNNDQRCENDCGETLALCEQGWVVGEAGAAVETAELQWTADAGTTWTDLAAAPFAAALDIFAVTRFYVGRSTVRVLVCENAAGAGQGTMSYSDDNGVTWTAATIGGAATNDGSTSGGTLLALDERHIYCAGNNGYIWISRDAGLTWEATEEGIVTATAYVGLSFDPSGTFGFAVATGADITAITDDGGLSWTAGSTAPSGGDDLLCCARLDRNKIWVGTDEGNLWWTDDGSVTWTQRTGWVGSGVGDIEDIQFVNDNVGWMTVDTAGPYGWLFRTIDGGFTWDRLVTPVNLGINQLWACDENHAFAVGMTTTAGNSFIAYAQPA